MPGFLLVLMLKIASVVHPLHVSVMEIDQQKNDIRVAFRIFHDDINSAITGFTGKPFVWQPRLADSTVTAYLEAHTWLMTENLQKRHFDARGYEVAGDALIFYGIVRNVGTWKSLTIYNDVLMELYDDQSNIINVNRKDQTKSLRLVPDRRMGTLTFN